MQVKKKYNQFQAMKAIAVASFFDRNLTRKLGGFSNEIYT